MRQKESKAKQVMIRQREPKGEQNEEGKIRQQEQKLNEGTNVFLFFLW